MKHLSIVYHSQSGKTDSMARAVRDGALSYDTDAVAVRMLTASETDPSDMIGADAIVFGTPENFGYMSGGMKDLFDRTFYPCEGRLQGLPFAVFIGAGNDGTGALTAVRRIAKGFPLSEAQEPIIARGPLDDAVLERCHTLGATMAAGLDLGVF